MHADPPREEKAGVELSVERCCRRNLFETQPLESVELNEGEKNRRHRTEQPSAARQWTSPLESSLLFSSVLS